MVASTVRQNAKCFSTSSECFSPRTASRGTLSPHIADGFKLLFTTCDHLCCGHESCSCIFSSCSLSLCLRVSFFRVRLGPIARQSGRLARRALVRSAVLLRFCELVFLLRLALDVLLGFVWSRLEGSTWCQRNDWQKRLGNRSSFFVRLLTCMYIVTYIYIVISVPEGWTSHSMRQLLVQCAIIHGFYVCLIPDLRSRIQRPTPLSVWKCNSASFDLMLALRLSSTLINSTNAEVRPDQDDRSIVPADVNFYLLATRYLACRCQATRYRRRSHFVWIRTLAPLPLRRQS